MRLLLEIGTFLLLQVVVFFAFYRLVLKDLPSQINDLLFKQHLANDFTELAGETAGLAREKLLKLESERLDAVIQYEGIKGRRGLSTTEVNVRNALKKSIDQLDKKINGCRARLNKMYAPEVLAHLRKFEELRLVSALNRSLDNRNKQ